jgi:hypothetical protein
VFSEKPIFVGVRFCARELGCWYGAVEKHLGKPDAILRFGARDQKAWLEKRIDHILPRAEAPLILYGRVEARRFVGISIRASQRILPDSLAVAFFPGFGGVMHPLFLESQLSEIRRSIASGRTRVQRRSLKAPKFQACISPARHCWNDDQSAEDKGVANARRESEFWSRMI